MGGLSLQSEPVDLGMRFRKKALNALRGLMIENISNGRNYKVAHNVPIRKRKKKARETIWARSTTPS